MPAPGSFLTELNLIFALHCSVLEKLQWGVGPRRYERCTPWVNLERATFIYIHQQVLVNFPCRVISVCYHKFVSCWEIFLKAERRMLFWAEVQTSGLPTLRASRDRQPSRITGAPFPGLGFGLLVSKCQQCSAERSTAGQSSVFCLCFSFVFMEEWSGYKISGATLNFEGFCTVLASPGRMPLPFQATITT